MTSSSNSQNVSTFNPPLKHVAGQNIDIVDLTGTLRVQSSPASISKIFVHPSQGSSLSLRTDDQVEHPRLIPKDLVKSVGAGVARSTSSLSTKAITSPIKQLNEIHDRSDQIGSAKRSVRHIGNSLTKSALKSHNQALSSSASHARLRNFEPVKTSDVSEFSVSDEEASEPDNARTHSTTPATKSGQWAPRNSLQRPTSSVFRTPLRSPATNSGPSSHRKSRETAVLGSSQLSRSEEAVKARIRTLSSNQSLLKDMTGRHKTPTPRSAARHRRSYTVDVVDSYKQRFKLNLPKTLQPEFRRCCVTEISLDLYKKNLQEHLMRMRMDQSYYVTTKLKHAREETTQSNSNFEQTMSPFLALNKVTTVSSNDKNVGRLGHWVKGTSERQNEAKRYKMEPLRQEQQPLPPYTAYISAKRNILTEDDRQRTCLPYQGDDFEVDDADKDYAALETKIEENQFRYHRLSKLNDKARMHQRYAETFLSQIGCSAEALLRYLVDETPRDPAMTLPKDCQSYWGLRPEYLKDGYYEEEDDKDALEREDTPYQPKPRKRWQQVSEQLPHVSERDLAVACVACKAFQDLTGFSLFHIVQGFVEDAKVSQDIYSLSSYTDLECFICKVHECPGHGEYQDNDEGKNQRQRVNFKPGSPDPEEKQNQKPDSQSVINLLGLQDDGEVTGSPWTTFKETSDKWLKDAELCSDDCFWVKQARIDKLSTWSTDDERAFEMLRPAFGADRRAPCIMAEFGIISKTCKEIFLKLLLEPSIPTQYSYRIRNELEAKDHSVPPRKTTDQWKQDPNNRKTWQQDAREPFMPCDHLGPCSKDTNCSCFSEGVQCEKFCACSTNCSRRFQGCRCHVKGKFCRSETCECRKLNRECDPDLCISCGSDDVLNPINRYNAEVVASKCGNVSITRGVPKRTLLGPSKLMADGGKSGWGLYMGEECKKGDFLGEYVGEIISGQEYDQRGTIYDKRNLSYLFTLNGVQTLDSTLIGNKLRFINHQEDPMSNCFAKLLLCNGAARIGLFALQDIAIGQEMFFDYGEGFAAKFDLMRMNPDGTVSIERPEKRARPKEAFKRRLNESRPPQYQLKNKINKNGLRIGRPPKKGRRLLLPPLVPETSDSTSSKRARSTPSEDQGVESVLRAIISTENEEQANRRKRPRHLSPEIDPDDDDVDAGNKRSLRSRRLANIKLSTESQSPGSTPSRHTTREASSQVDVGMNTRARLRNTSQPNNSPLPTPLSERSSTIQRQSTTEVDLSEDQEGSTPRRSTRRRLEKQHFEETTSIAAARSSQTPTPTRLRRTARKEVL